ncbi:hypothetical protein [Vibrio coralliilyticus]|uniref:hypothetical protein n=1 Tax=Vibrio coralliilyticus TaxID=190893 RepID=UPI000BAAD035|nr:hypothetical protein [Vibrio coralliilyticus]NOI59153.1 hypothetical protein [Vibrio coralliilyticus]PAT66207.1 hypothetical protein CKA27_20510 [Vibrio coralliilyticus]WFB50967.1 hypothetical protein P6988_25775 [Vibrio coralliilyticus]
MTENNKVLTDKEVQQVSGGAVGAGIDGAGAIADGITRLINSSGAGVDGLTRPSPKPKNGNTCCCNCRRI